MRTAIIIVGIAALVCNLLAFVMSAQQAPGPSSTKPVVPAPQGNGVSPTAPPIAYLHSPHTINVAPGVAITITSTNGFTVGQARKWLRQASMNPLK